MPMGKECTMPTDHATLLQMIDTEQLGEFSSLLQDFKLAMTGPDELVGLHRKMREEALRRADEAHRP